MSDQTTEPPSEFDHALFYVSIFGNARHRDLCNWLALRAWWVSETGVFGWIGDCFDVLTVRSLRVAAGRHLKRKRTETERAKERLIDEALSGGVADDGQP
jgi:hypothetical protein